MKKVILVSILCVYSIILKSQNEENRRFYIGGYYTLLIEQTLLEKTSDPIQFTHHFINTNAGYALSHKWRVGVEYMVSLTNFKEIEDPFHIFGLNIEYDLLRSKKSKLNLRGGVSFGNLLYAGDFEPKRRSVMNRVLGISYEYKISKTLYLYTGLYGHLPFNKIPYKYSSGHPFIGIGRKI